jgi:NADPH:quinone reductase-like Zn-dependent oxidoreductase
MRAAWFEEFGAASDVLKVGQLDAPEAGPGEVLVRMHTRGWLIPRAARRWPGHPEQ